MQSINDLPYTTDALTPGDRRTLLVRLPEKSNRRCIFFIHGGGWTAGSKEQWSSVAECFCDLGYVCVSAGYRLAPDYRFPTQFEDVRLAYAFVKERAGEWDFDPQLMASWGSSAGGHLAALLATSDEQNDLGVTPAMPLRDTRPAAVVGYCPVFSVLPDARVNVPQSVLQLLGDHPQNCLELARLASPLAHVKSDTPPFLIINGDADDVTPLGHQEAMVGVLREYNVPVELAVLPGVGHGFGYGVTSEAQKTAMKYAQKFLEEKLAG